MSRRIVKFLVSWMLWLWDQTAASLRRWVGRGPGAGTCIVLYYHSVPKRSRSGFARQMDLLLKLARPIPATSPAALAPGVLHAAITFDDAFCSFAESAMPELAARGLPCTVFVPAGCLGKEPDWEAREDASWKGEKVMTRQELSRLAASGLVTIGSHGLGHRDLTTLNEKDLQTELRSPKEILESNLGTRISALSFPYGSFGAREIRSATDVGYGFLFCSQPAMLKGALRPGLIGRVCAEPTDWLFEFKLKLSGAYRWVCLASRLKRRIKRLIR